MYTIKVKIDIKKDAWNWWYACNSHSFGMSWRKRISRRMQNKLIGASQKDAYKYLLPYLQRLYKRLKIESKISPIQEIFTKKKERVFQLMEKVTGKKIFRNDFILILTTIPRAPYNYPEGEVWLPIVWPDKFYVAVFLHELLHFQTYAYWRKKCLKKMSNKEFENLKEALTVILNDEFKSIMGKQDKGYRIHKYLREELLVYWRRHKDFNRLVNYGVKIYSKYAETIKYLQFGKYTKECPKEFLNKINQKRPKGVREILELINKKFFLKKYKISKPRSFKKSRFITVDKIIKIHQASCGSLATLVASIMRSFNLPTKLIDGYYVKDNPKMQHAWNEIYFPRLNKFIAFDITRKNYKIGKYHIRKGEHLDWSELER